MNRKKYFYKNHFSPRSFTKIDSCRRATPLYRFWPRPDDVEEHNYSQDYPYSDTGWPYLWMISSGARGKVKVRLHIGWRLLPSRPYFSSFYMASFRTPRDSRGCLTGTREPLEYRLSPRYSMISLHPSASDVSSFLPIAEKENEIRNMCVLKWI